jgi:hypothetical protein
MSFLDPLIESWDINLKNFGMEIVLNHRLASGHPKKFEFVEKEPGQPEEEPGLKEFLNNSFPQRDCHQGRDGVLKKLRFNGKRSTSLYYYRELQSLRDPLHFRGKSIADAELIRRAEISRSRRYVKSVRRP